MKHTVLIFLAILAAGCATTPTPIQKATPVPASRIYIQPAAAADSAEIVVVRDTGMTGGATYVHLFIDNKQVAALDTGEILRLRVKPADIALGVKLTQVLGAINISSIDQRLQAGKTYYYRILVDQYTGAHIQRFFP